ncbi:shikimate kinase AroK [Sulfurirhabdus autotrophica]|nr:shikimate kinase AroK [Sulfurirhabdus autotrophica]
MTSNIFLVGLMGAGKTTVGKLLAKHLNKTFFDSDQEIERRTGVNIPLIFEIEGEPGFRSRESGVIADLANMDNIVLATGGGAILNAQNREVLSQRGTVIYLRATVDDLWQRTRHDKNRPLLQTQDPQEKLKELFALRDPLYREIADIIIDTSKQSVQNLVHQLEEKLAQL